MRIPSLGPWLAVALLVLDTAACSDTRTRSGAEDAADDGTPTLDVPHPIDVGPDGDSGDGDAVPDSAPDTVPDAVPDLNPTECPMFITALADCPFRLVRSDPDACPELSCLDVPCATDADCVSGVPNWGGDHCVAGNCVDCWEDTQCDGVEFCRGGRCVMPAPLSCPSSTPCDVPGCSQITVSEAVCVACVCDSVFSVACDSEADCLPISRYPYSRCVYGTCGDCAGDGDCTGGAPCLSPGLCYAMLTHPSVLYGTWLLGWAGGLNHYSYLRFEPDGTLRRGRYEAEVAWSDDVPQLPCDVGTFPPPTPLLGRWEPELTNSGFLVVRMSLNVPCDDGVGWEARYRVTPSADGASATFEDIDGNGTYDAMRVAADACEPDMSRCDPPTF